MTYRVTGPNRYLDHPPGSTFIADLPEAMEARAVARGHIVVVDRSPLRVDPERVHTPKRAVKGPSWR